MLLSLVYFLEICSPSSTHYDVSRHAAVKAEVVRLASGVETPLVLVSGKRVKCRLTNPLTSVGKRL